ncbi:MAG: type II secretion system F family protein [Candidatus Poribacteria bacterium]|nr:type II secretion system F family protein [Candidatus Poribacteria bacterium]
MPRYAYEAMTNTGARTRGAMDATSQRDLVARLRSMGYFPTRIQETAGAEKKGLLNISFGDGISRKDVEFFTFQLSTLVNSGIPLDRALSIVSGQTENKALQRIVEAVRQDVEQGESLSDALAKHPKQFDELFTNMVKAGQEGGVLGLVLARLSEFSRQQRELRESVTSAMIYPIILLGFAVLIVLVLMFVVIPRFIKMFTDLDMALPLSTQILIAMVNYLQSPFGFAWLYNGIPVPGATLTLTIVGLVAARQYGKTDNGRRFFDRARMKIPLMGTVVRNFALVRLTQTLSTLLENGVTLLPALRIGKDTTGSVVFRDALEHAESEVERGSSLSHPLAESGLFPPIVTDMLAIGEESGKPEIMLEKLAEYYDLEIKRSLERLVAALGPLLILFMAAIVVFIALSIVLPIFNLSQALG